MLVGFVGDAHGRVFHALAAVVTWQVRTGKRFDLLIQVGDLGAFPDVNQMDPASNRYLAVDPSEADFSRLLQAEGERAEALAYLREQIAAPIYFIRGNHEDFAWLQQLLTHQGPYGTSVGYHGDIHGSQLMSQLAERTQPAFHVAGHAHCLSGPRIFGQTTYLGLDCLVASPLWHPDAQGFQAGCLAVLDTEDARLWPVTDPWLSHFETPFDFDSWFRRYMMTN